MIYGVKFGETHSIRDWHLYLSEPPSISLPEPVTRSVSIPGRDGVLDLTEVVDGRVVYGARTISMTFLSDVQPSAYWPKLQRAVAGTLHGRSLDISIDDDPDWCWRGRCQVKSWQQDGNRVKVKISAEVDPFRWEVIPTVLAASYPAEFSDAVPISGCVKSDWSSENRWAAGLTFGSRSEPKLDLSPFATVEVAYDARNPVTEEVSVAFYDQYNRKKAIALSDAPPVGALTAAVSDLTSSAFDPTSIWKVSASGIAGLSLRGYLSSTAAGVLALPECQRVKDVVITRSGGVSGIMVGGRLLSLSDEVTYSPDLDIAGEQIALFTGPDPLVSGVGAITYTRGLL